MRRMVFSPLARLASVVLLAMCSLLTAHPALAESSASPPSLALPARGQSEALVLQDFGEPLKRHPTAGGGRPRHPPITRWDYPGYSVFFENTTVVDVVIENQPPELSHVDELQPAPDDGAQ